MANNEKLELLIESNFVESQDINQIEKVMNEQGIILAEKDVSIYIQIANTLVDEKTNRNLA